MKRFKNIVYVVEDLAAEQSIAITRVMSLAENNQALVTLLHVLKEPRLGPFSDSLVLEDVRSQRRQQSIEQLESLRASFGKGVHVTVDVRFGRPFVEVIRDVLRNQRDLVAKTAGDGGEHAFLFSGTDQHLLRKCPCPVWVLNEESSANYRRIIAAVDFDPWNEENEADETDELNQRILALASSLAVSDFAELHVVHVWEPITDSMIRVFGRELSEKQIEANRNHEWRKHQYLLDALDRRLQEEAGTETYDYLSPRFYLREGNPRKVIPSIAEELKADLVVMGTLSRAGIPGLLIGNTAEVVLNNLECSVLTVKPSAFVTPVNLP